MYVPEPPLADAANSTFNGAVPDVGLAEHDRLSCDCEGFTFTVGHCTFIDWPTASLTVTTVLYVPAIVYVCVIEL